MPVVDTTATTNQGSQQNSSDIAAFLLIFGGLLVLGAALR